MRETRTRSQDSPNAQLHESLLYYPVTLYMMLEPNLHIMKHLNRSCRVLWKIFNPVLMYLSMYVTLSHFRSLNLSKHEMFKKYKCID